MTHLLMTTWDGVGHDTAADERRPRAGGARAQPARARRPGIETDVEATGAEHVSWTRAPHRTERSLSRHFIEDWAGLEPAEGFARMRDRLAVGPAAAFAADVREELARRPAAAVLTELLLFGPQVAAEAAQVPCIVLEPDDQRRPRARRAPVRRWADAGDERGRAPARRGAGGDHDGGPGTRPCPRSTRRAPSRAWNHSSTSSTRAAASPACS